MSGIRFVKFTFVATALCAMQTPGTARSTVIDFSNHGGIPSLPYSEDGLTFTITPSIADGQIDTTNNDLVLAPVPTGVGYSVTATHDAGAPFNLESLVYSANVVAIPDSFTITSNLGGSISIPISSFVTDLTIDFAADPLFQGIGSFSILHGPSDVAPTIEVIVHSLAFNVVPEPNTMGVVVWAGVCIGLGRRSFRSRVNEQRSSEV